jgi:ribulose-5-phosphate 4-epimerase/fuculose-1-phosphate aldolase
MLLHLAHTIADYTICGEGNVSERQTEDTFLIKASGTSLHTLSGKDLVLVDTDAQQLKPEQKKPSIEVLFHAWIMKHFPEINYIAHTSTKNYTDTLLPCGQ